MMLVVRLDVPVALLAFRSAGRLKVREEGRCRLCERPWAVRRPTRHHLIPQSWFGRRGFVIVSAYGTATQPRHLIRDADANIVPLCAPCHADVEADAGTRRLLRKRLGAQEVAFVVGMRSQRWFDTVYPASAHAGVSQRSLPAVVR